MLKESHEFLRELRERVAKELTILADLEGKFEASHFKSRAKDIALDFRVVDMMFLSTGTPFEEAQWMRYAEMNFQMALSKRKELEGVLATFGPTVIAIPSLSR